MKRRSSLEVKRANELAKYGVETFKALDVLSEDEFQTILAEAQAEAESKGAKYEVEQKDKERKELDRVASITNFQSYFNMNLKVPARGPQGYCYDLPQEDYFSFPAVNASLLSHATPCEMLHYLVEPREDEFASASAAEANTTGTLLHWAVLEPWKFDEAHRHNHMLMCETEGLGTKKAQEQRKDNPGKLLVTPALLEKAFRCREAVALHPAAMHILNDPDIKREVSGFVFDVKFGIWRKVRYDLLPARKNFLADVKTTARPLWDFEREVRKFYTGQSAWYMDTHELLTGERRESFIWIVVTKSEPFMCRLFEQPNLRRDLPLYKDSLLQAARERIGLDEGERPRLARLPMFIAAAQETMAAREDGATLDKLRLRRIFEAYEFENPIQTII